MFANRDYRTLVALAIGTIVQIAFADGGFVSDILKDVSAPDQKVAIVWDGQNETMILATKVRLDELAALGWIIPIKSTEKPEIQLGNTKIFYDLSEYFGTLEKTKPAKRGTAGGKGSPDSIEILETKKLDLYDVVILRATDSTQLYNWLKKNDFQINRVAKRLLDFYATEDFFFITVKIDSSDKHEDALLKLRSGLYAPLKISSKTNRVFFPLKISSMNTGRVNIAAYIFSKEPQKDASSILNVSKWQPLTKGFNLRISDYLPLDGSSCVTKLTFEGPSSSFTNDVYFTNMSSKDRSKYLGDYHIKANFSLERLLDDAIVTSNVDALKKAIDNGADVNATIKAGRAALHEAALYHDNNEITSFLIERGADVNIRDLERKTPLDLAVWQGHLKVVDCLIKHGAVLGDTSLHNSREYTLHTGILIVEAAAAGKREIVELLLQNGVDPNCERRYGVLSETPLQAAARAGHTNIAKLLIENGADVEACAKVDGSYGWLDPGITRERWHRPIVIAVRAGHIEMVRLLLKLGASPRSEGNPYVRSSPLLAAAETGNAEMVNTLLEKGADLNPAYPPTPLWAAAKAGHKEIVNLLLSKGVELNDIANTAWCGTPLEIAEGYGHKDIAELLLHYGATRTHYVPGVAYQITNEQLDRLKIGMSEEEVTGTLSKYHHQLPTCYPDKTVWFYWLRPAPGPKVSVPVYVVFENKKLVAYGQRNTLLDYLDAKP